MAELFKWYKNRVHETIMRLDGIAVFVHDAEFQLFFFFWYVKRAKHPIENGKRTAVVFVPMPWIAAVMDLMHGRRDKDVAQIRSIAQPNMAMA